MATLLALYDYRDRDTPHPPPPTFLPRLNLFSTLLLEPCCLERSIPLRPYSPFPALAKTLPPLLLGILFLAKTFCSSPPYRLPLYCVTETRLPLPCWKPYRLLRPSPPLPSRLRPSPFLSPPALPFLP